MMHIWLHLFWNVVENHQHYKHFYKVPLFVKQTYRTPGGVYAI